MLTVHTIEYFSHTCNLYYRIFLSSSQCTLWKFPSCLQSTFYRISHHADNPHFIEYPIMRTIHTLSNIPSCLHSTLIENFSVKFTVHTIGYSHHVYSSPYWTSHHAYSPHYRIFLSCLQFTLPNIPIKCTMHSIECSIMLANHTMKWHYHTFNSHYRIFPSYLQFTLSNNPSYLQFTPSNIPIIFAVHSIECSIMLALHTIDRNIALSSSPQATSPLPSTQEIIQSPSTK